MLLRMGAVRTHKENLKHFRAELERQGVQVIGVRLNKRLGCYAAHSTNLVNGAHCFYWKPGTVTVRGTNINATGKEKDVCRLTVNR